MVRNLRDIRKAKKITQEELSKITGIHRVLITKYETGKIDPTVEKAKKLADGLGVTVNDLIGADRE